MKRSKPQNKTTYTCSACGLVLSVEDPCNCDPCDVICCGQDMEVGVC
ncbi:MAG: hypothetical protein ACM3L6_00955 [Deltaproteobacteria bacterium]